MIVKDAEGATKFIKITVKGARTSDEARIAAFSVANSVLFKTAMFGQNPNYGRIIQAVGASSITLNKEPSIRVSSLLKKKIYVEIGLKEGKEQATVFTCDLTPGYVKINAGYN